MSSYNKKRFLANLRQDIPASIVVFLVALPLCLGIALASGAPLFAGVIAGIIGGIVVGALSGSPLGVSGPAAGLAVIVLNAIGDLGFSAFLAAVVIGGVFQIMLGIVRAGIIGYYFPSAVIKGMLSGIGILIFIKQIPHAFGYDKDPEGDFAFTQVDGHNTVNELFYMWEQITPGAMIIAGVSLAILLLWDRPFMKKIPGIKIVPGPLVAVVTGILLNFSFASSPTLSLAGDHIVSLPVAESVSGFFSMFASPDWGAFLTPKVIFTGFTIALVASLETLLCVEATDKLDPYKRITPTNRELIAQGIGNMFSGLIGGLPITQVIVRSSANIQSGGRSKSSAIIHGVLLLGTVIAIPKILNMIPLASLAAVLLVVGYKLAKPALFIQMYKSGWSQFVPFVVTIAGILFTNLLYGIGLGLVVGIFQILWNSFKTPYNFETKDFDPEKPIRIELAQDVSFLNKAMIMNTLSHIPNDTHVIIDGSKTRTMHPDVIEIIEEFKINAPTRGIDLEVIEHEEAAFINPLKGFKKVVLEQKDINKPTTEGRAISAN